MQNQFFDKQRWYRYFYGLAFQLNEGIHQRIARAFGRMLICVGLKKSRNGVVCDVLFCRLVTGLFFANGFPDPVGTRQSGGIGDRLSCYIGFGRGLNRFGNRGRLCR